LLPESFSVKVKVLGGGFGLWLGDNIVILSMVKRAHLLFSSRGFSQVEGIDYEEAFSHVARYTSIWMIISPAASMG
jgi:hypothetical protein